MTSTQRIICICSGNICRSPMAVALLREQFRARDIPAVVISAGTLEIQGRRAAEFARVAIAELGDEIAAHIEEHRSQGVSPPLLEMADHIVVMSPRHQDYVRRHAPRANNKVVRLWEFAEDSSLETIEDPVGLGLVAFRQCRDLIEQCLQRWLDDEIQASD